MPEKWPLWDGEKSVLKEAGGENRAPLTAAGACLYVVANSIRGDLWRPLCLREQCAFQEQTEQIKTNGAVISHAALLTPPCLSHVPFKWMEWK
jgi:hypothetical protein